MEEWRGSLGDEDEILHVEGTRGTAMGGLRSTAGVKV